MIVLILMSVLVLSYHAIDIFTRHQVISSSRIAKIQHDVSVALEHINKNAVLATGNEVAGGANTVVRTAGSQVSFHIDRTGHDSIADTWIAYRLDAVSHQIQFCPACSSAACGTCAPTWGSDPTNLISEHIVSFIPVKLHNPMTESFIEVRICACWDPTTGNCATPATNNPCVTMDARVYFPSISFN